MIVERMTETLAGYEVLPRVFPAGERRSVRIRPMGAHFAFEEGSRYLVRVLPMEHGIEPLPVTAFPGTEVTAEGGTLRFDWIFEDEQEHFLLLYALPEDQKPIGKLRVYSLQADLFAMRPYRGDFHVHSCRSDGKEAPAIVAANYRKAGFDFLALTDHDYYAPSLEAIAAYEGQPVDLRLFPGEEVHAPDNHIHIVNFGGSFSLNDVFRDERARYDAEVDAIEDKLSVPPGVNRREAAACHWAFDNIRKGGGLAIFPHPHWNSCAYHVPDDVSRYLFASRAFDAFEVLGGQDAFYNNMQTAFYGDMRANGITAPIVGSSDSHGTVDAKWFDWISTIVFSPSLEWGDLRQSVLDLRSVAVETYPGEQPRFYGPYRVVKFAMFLWYTYFPFHAELCYEEGLQMKAYATGGEGASAVLGALSGRTDRLLAKWYGDIR